MRAVASCNIDHFPPLAMKPIPHCVISPQMCGHQPTAAAEMAVPVRNELLQRLRQLSLRMSGAVRRHVDRAGERLEAQSRLMPKLTDLSAPHQQRTDELAERLRQSLRTRVAKAELSFSGPAECSTRGCSAARRTGAAKARWVGPTGRKPAPRSTTKARICADSKPPC